jgi:hypothetical protein
MSKDKVYSNNPHTEEDLKKIIHDVMCPVSPQEL